MLEHIHTWQNHRILIQILCNRYLNIKTCVITMKTISIGSSSEMMPKCVSLVKFCKACEVVFLLSDQVEIPTPITLSLAPSQS